MTMSELMQARRAFVRLAVVGATAAVLGDSLRACAADTDALLLSCMDYRLVEATERYMAGRGLRKKYDHVILAGAALGAVTDKFPAWNRTFWEHLDVAIDLHHIQKVLLLDH